MSECRRVLIRLNGVRCSFLRSTSGVTRVLETRFREVVLGGAGDAFCNAREFGVVFVVSW